MRSENIWIPLLCAAALAPAQTPSPALLVLNKEDATLAIMDPGSGKATGSVPVGESPHEVTVSADGRLAFVSNYGSKTPGRTISVIDIAGRKELRRFDLGPLRKPHGMAFSGGKVYFTAEANRLIGRYDPAANVVDWLMGTGLSGTHMVLPSRDGSMLFTANIGSDSISVIEGSNATVIPVGKGPEGLDLSPDGRELWTAHSRDGGISVIDVAAKRVTHTLNIGTQRSNRIKFTTDGKLVLVSDMGGGELVVLDAAARKQVKRIKIGRNPEGILTLPGRAYVAVAGDNQVAVLDLHTLEVTRRIATGAGPDGLAWAEPR